MDKQTVTYTNWLEFNGRKLAFKKKLLFDITGVPKLINQTMQGYWIKGKLLSPSKAKELIKNESLTIDLTGLQWYVQCNIQECINLNLQYKK